MEIQIIQPDQYVAALEVMNTIVQELWGIPLDHVREVDSLADLDDIKGYYLDSGGIFFVVLDKGQVVGSGGIHPIDKTTCELKRVWLLPPYRGKGLGKQLTKMLIGAAKHKGFQRVVLEVATPEKQRPAVTLYEELGFHQVEKYKAESICPLAMEMVLC